MNLLFKNTFTTTLLDLHTNFICLPSCALYGLLQNLNDALIYVHVQNTVLNKGAYIYSFNVLYN